MYKTKVLQIHKYAFYPRTQKKNRIILDVEHFGTIYYLDVTNELQQYGIGYDFDIEILKKSLPISVYASFTEIDFRISKTSMEEWMKNVGKVSTNLTL